MEKAGFLSRFTAWILDIIFMGILAYLVAWVLEGFIDITSSADNWFLNWVGAMTFIIAIIVLLLFQFFYFGYFWSKNGKSLGMRLLSMKVVRQSEGEDLSFLRAGLRGTFGYWISGLVFGLGYLWALIDANKETWHDKIFDTWVVKD